MKTNPASQLYRIMILEDNPYYNKLLKEELQQYSNQLVHDKNIGIEIDSFSSYSDFLHNFNTKTNIAFIDFYLEDNKTAIDALREIKHSCMYCRAIVLSDIKNIWNMYQCLAEGASGIIVKDESAFALCTYIIDQHITKRA